jgi:membrane-bound lytic murein transglycosylase F
MKHSLYFFLGYIFLVTMLNGCQNPTRKEKENLNTASSVHQADLKEILQDSKLTILAENSANSYFIYRGQKMGLEYEILREFARSLGVDLEVKIVKNLDLITDQLNNGEGDIISCNYTITKERKKKIDFSIPFMRTSQVLVQRKPENWKEMRRKEWNAQLITDPSQLIGKKIHVWKNSSYFERMINLQDELGDTIYLEPLDGDINPEDIIELVDKGFIDYTVTDQNVARINQRFYPNIDASLELSVKQKIAFGLRKSSPLLQKSLNNFLTDFMKTATFSYIKHKYLNMSKYAGKSKGNYASTSGNQISPYDQIIQAEAQKSKWDWRLLAALIYQESKFRLGQQSWAGAYGLMQFMPSVGPSYGVYPDSPPAVQIKGGMRKLSDDYNGWEDIPDSLQRFKFTLATYNAGKGHILDAQRLAKKNGKDPLVWDNNVEIFINRLSQPKYYQDPVCYYGYMRGSETYKYVREIFIRFSEYKTAFDLDV